MNKQKISNTAHKKQAVILLHGWGRTDKSMLIISYQLKKAGYLVVNINYPSNEKNIAELAQIAVGQGIEQSNALGADIIHFVTHSLGGILVRQYFKEREMEKLGRVIMLGAPNNGSEVIDMYRKLTFFRRFSGPAGLELGTTEQDVPKQLGSVRFELGVIAGSRSINPFLSLLLHNSFLHLLVSFFHCLINILLLIYHEY